MAEGDFLLVCKSDTTIGVPVGLQSEIPRELWDSSPELVEQMARDGLDWYAKQAGAEPTGPVRWTLSLCGNSFIPPIKEGVWE